MNLREKLRKLSRLNDLALFKWTASQHRIADDFILLSDLRLNVLTCDDGKIVFSTAAPILYMDRGHPRIQFRDRDVMTIVNGARRGINVRSDMIRDDEQATEARYCSSRVITNDSVIPKWLEQKIMSLGNSVTYPVAQLRLPEMFRISKKPDTLKPLFSTELIKAIGGERGDGIQQLLDKFHANLDLFGMYTTEGYIISNDYIATGGCVVCASKGISMRAGSVVYMTTLRGFISECQRRHWYINTTNNLKEVANDMAGASDTNMPASSDASNSNHGIKSTSGQPDSSIDN